jgi:hypothetical protein
VGSVSTTVIVPDVAALPVLLTSSVYVPVCPAVKFPVCDFVSASVALPASVVGSVATGAFVAPPPDTVAELVTLPEGPTALTVSAIGLPDAPAAIAVVLVQVADAPLPLQLHPVPLALLKVRPVGNVSTTVIVPEVGAVPVLPTAIVYVPVCPTVKVPVCVLLTASTGRSIAVGSVAVGALVAPPPDAPALFVRGDGAFPATFTVSVMGFPLALAAIVVVLVHVAD